jgi:hypothetical protein
MVCCNPTLPVKEPSVQRYSQTKDNMSPLVEGNP